MELELKKECLDTYELGEPQTLTQEETAETIVPDYCPDIARIISAEGVVCLHGGTEQDGVTGTVRVTVLYTPENESGVRALEFAMPFSAQGEGLAGCAHVVVETEIELLESRMLNPRKIFTRCKLVTHLAGCRKVCLTISSDAETDPALLVEKRCCGQTVSLLRQVAEKDLTFSETMSLSLGREGAAELLHCRANGIVTETKAIGNKLIFKGVFLVSVLYRTIGGQLASASAELPFSQIMETDSAEENTQVSMRLRITGTDIQIDGSDDEGRQLSVTVYYHTMAFLRETREVTLLTDLYSTAYETRYEPSQLDLCSLYESVTRRQTVREVLEIGVAAEAVLSLCADCGAVSVSREGEITQLRTAVTVRALYLDEGGVPLASLLSDANGAAGPVTAFAPDKSYSLDVNNSTVRPYALYRITASLDGWQTLTLSGVQVFDGEQTIARLELLPAQPALLRADSETADQTVTLPPHPLFVGGGGSGPAPTGGCPVPFVLNEVVIPKKITVHLGKPSANVRNVTVRFQDYIANVASGEIYPSWGPKGGKLL